MLRTAFLVTVTLTLLFAGCRNQTHTVTGTLTLASNGTRPIDQLAMSGKVIEACDYSDLGRENSDIYTGAQITLKNASGKLIAKGTLQGGTIVSLNGMGGCEFVFVLQDVPKTEFYTVDLGTRKGISYSLKDMQEKNWHLKIWLSI